MADEYLVALQATIDDSSISNLNTKIDGLANKLNPIELKINTSNVESKIKDIRKQIEDLSKIKIDLGQGNIKGGTATVNQQTKAMKELLSIANQIDKLTLKAGGMKSSGVAGLDTARIEEAQNHLRALYSTYQGLYDRLSEGNLSKKAFEGLKGDIRDTKQQLVSLEGELTSMQSKLVTGIKTDIGNGKMGSQIADIEARFRSLGVESQEVNSNIQLLKTLMSQMDATNDIESVVADYKQFQQILIQTTNQVKTLKREQATNTANIKLSNAKASLSSDIDLWLKNNSAAAKKFGAELSNIQAQIKSADATQLSNLKAQFQDVKKQAQLAGVAGKTMGDQFKQSIKTVGNYLSAAMLISRAVSVLRTGVNTVIDLDTALIDLRKTTKATREELEQFYYSANETAKRLGTTTEEVIQAAAEWSRLGYSIKDAQTMAETSSIFSSISPNVDISKATDGLVSVMKAFNIEADDALDGIASKINAIGNSQAVSNENIIDFLTRSSSAMKEANNTLDETIALGTAA